MTKQELEEDQKMLKEETRASSMVVKINANRMLRYITEIHRLRAGLEYIDTQYCMGGCSDKARDLLEGK